MSDSFLKVTVSHYLQCRISRRTFLHRLAAMGLGSVFASSYIQLLEASPAKQAGIRPIKSTTIKGTGGDILVEQLQRAGNRFVFANPSSGSGPVFDALINRPGMQVILGVQEDSLAAMADGFAKASGKVPFVIVSRPGFPNTTGTQFNAFRDRIPILFCVDNLDEQRRGSFAQQEVDNLLDCAGPFTRWRWENRNPNNIAEDLRRAFKFTSTPPPGPVALSIPDNHLFAEVEATVYDQEYFDVSHQIRADTADVERIARQLINSTSPILYVGNEVHRYGAEPEVIELAELLSVPVVHQNFSWCQSFPTDHALYVGDYQPGARYPANIDFMLDLGGGRGPYQNGPSPSIPRDRKLVEVKLDIESMGRTFPAHQLIPANVKLFTRDLVDSVRSQVSDKQVMRFRSSRRKATAEYSSRRAAAQEQTGKQHWSDQPLSHERIGMELERHLHPEACIVHEADSSRIVLNYLTRGYGKKRIYTISGLHMGWAVGASMGVKLALPDHQVVALIGDGGFMFGGSQALWAAARYQIPVIIIVANNNSYDGERSRIFSKGALQAELGKDMLCYLGDPDIQYTRFAAAYGIDAVKVESPDQFVPALKKAFQATKVGQPFLLDVTVGRRGAGADLVWYPKYSLANESQNGVKG